VLNAFIVFDGIFQQSVFSLLYGRWRYNTSSDTKSPD